MSWNVNNFIEGDVVWVKVHRTNSTVVYEGITVLTEKGMSGNWTSKDSRGYEIIPNKTYGDILRHLTKLEKALR